MHLRMNSFNSQIVTFLRFRCFSYSTVTGTFPNAKNENGHDIQFTTLWFSCGDYLLHVQILGVLKINGEDPLAANESVNELCVK